MKRVLAQIEQEKDALSEGRLFQLLSNDEISGRERLSFAPSMLYYLMGFKDVLDGLARANPSTDLDRFINAYCVEDGDHWRWFLTDLERLGYSVGSHGHDLPTFCNEVWGDRNRMNRTTIFELMYQARVAARDPLLALTLINVFEATGVVFIGHTRKAAIDIGLDDELKYFGRVHFEEEFGHSVQSRDLVAYDLTPESYEIAQAMIPSLFADYRELFDSWADHVGSYRLVVG